MLADLRRIFTLVVLVTAVASCGPDGGDGGKEESDTEITQAVEDGLQDGKEDSPNRPVILGDIVPDVPVQGDVRQERRFIAWTFNAITPQLAALIQATGSPRPNSALAVLLLWRPNCDSPWRTVAIVDGRLSQSLPVDGDYLIVVGPRNAQSAGRIKTVLSVGLRHAEFHYLQNLLSIHPLEDLPRLASIEFDNCKKLRDHVSIGKSRSLQRALFNHCGSISSLGFLREMPTVREFRFVGTDIQDGDLTPLLVRAACLGKSPRRTGYPTAGPGWNSPLRG